MRPSAPVSTTAGDGGVGWERVEGEVEGVEGEDAEEEEVGERESVSSSVSAPSSPSLPPPPFSSLHTREEG